MDRLTIHAIVSERAHHAPDVPALLAPGRRPLSYSGLRGLIAETVSALNAAGIGRSSRVALLLPNGPEMAAAFCGVASGAVCAPLNPAYGRKEFEFFLTDLEASALVVADGMESPAVAVAEASGIPVFRLVPAHEKEAGVFSLAGPGIGGPARPEYAQADDVALMLHTSGTTSRPKLVPLRHVNVCSSARNIRHTLALTERDCCLNVMPLFHIHGLMAAVLSSLAAGAGVVCTSGFHAADFFTWLREFQPTWYTAVPTMHQAILAHAESQGQPDVAAQLRFIRSSSSSLPPTVMAALESVFRAPVIESYGMTEASHQMASNALPPGARKPGSVGVAAGPEVAIVDEAGDLLPRGERGEVVIRGASVMSGYELNDAANQHAFTNGWFRTGDQGYCDGDGYLFLTGRLKEIINRGGEKISPREVDEALLEHPEIRQVVTFAIPHAQLGEDIGAAVVLKENAALTERGVREFAESRLAAFKVPAVVKIVEQIPKGPTGKLQRIGLAAKLGIERLDYTTKQGPAEHVEPRNPLESALSEVWREILAVDKISVRDNFFAIGGASLVATQLIARAQEATGIGLSMLDFLEAPTIAAMAERMATRTPSSSDGLVAIQPKGNLRPLFCAAGHDGNLLGFTTLASRLGPGQPLLGFAPVESLQPDASTVEAIASRCIEVMRARQPEGPYSLIGICFGGKVAYEMACQLHEQGQRVELLAILNSFNEHAFRRLPRGKRLKLGLLNSGRRVKFHLRNLLRGGPKQAFEYLGDRLHAFVELSLVQFVHRLRGRAATAGPRFLASQPSRNRYAGDSWVPRSYPGTVVLCRDSAPRASVHPSPQMGWEGLIPEDSDVLIVPEDDFRFWVQANISFVADSLVARLKTARAASDSTANLKLS